MISEAKRQRQIKAAKQWNGFLETTDQEIQEAYTNVPNVLTSKNMPMTPDEFVDLIDEFFEDAFKNRISRFDVRWGKWSRTMNEELRARILSKKDPFESLLKYVIIYWTLISELLELHFRYPLYKQSKKRKVMKELKSVKSIIRRKDPVDIDYNNVMKKVMRGFQ